MKNPFHAFHAPTRSETPVEGPPIASGAVPRDPAAAEIGEQTEMMTRLRRRNRVGELSNSDSRTSEESKERR